jgi:NADPH2:quinone reductase
MDTMKAVRVDICGAPEQMSVKDVPTPQPGPGEVRIKLKACGINLIDTYHRSGLYPLALPTGLGCEGAGVVDALGEGVDDLREGDRVGFAMGLGAYAEAIVLPRGALVKIPAGVSDEEAAAVLLKAMTVDYLFNDTFPLQGGETVLFHAAAGGVGLIACQWAKHKGVKLIGTASTQAKCELAVRHGAESCLLTDDPELSEKLRAQSPGGFPVVYDSVGRSTYRLSLGVLAPLGTFVSFGNASGPIDAVVPGELALSGSLYFTRPTLATHMARPGWMQASADRIFNLIEGGHLSVDVNQRYALSDVVRAHQDLEGRRTTGSSVLIP